MILVEAVRVINPKKFFPLLNWAQVFEEELKALNRQPIEIYSGVSSPSALLAFHGIAIT